VLQVKLQNWLQRHLWDAVWILAITASFLSIAQQDRSPWTHAFYRAALFDGQGAAAASFIQVASGGAADCLIWPGVPPLAFGRVLASSEMASTGFDDLDARGSPASKQNFLSLVDSVSRKGNLMSLTVILTLLLATYVCLKVIFGSSLLAGAGSIYLAVSQSVATHSAMLRTEGWSLLFLVLALLTIAGATGSFLNRRSLSLQRFSWVQAILFGFLLASAVLSKVNVAPAVAAAVILYFTLICKGGQNEAGGGQPLQMLLASAVIPLLIFPWWVFQDYTGLTYANRSGFDELYITEAITSDELLRGRLYAVALCSLPLVLLLIAFVARAKRGSQAFSRFGHVSYASGWVLTGGLVSLHLWSFLIGSATHFVGHQLHIVDGLIATVLGENPYVGDVTFTNTLAFVLANSTEYIRPHLGDILANLDVQAVPTRYVNGMLVALASTPFLLVALARRQWRRTAAFGLGCVLLALFTEALSSARGSNTTDMRYVIYAQWYAAFGLVAAVWLLQPQRLPSIRVQLAVQATAFLLIMGIATIYASAPLGRAQQGFRYGRQIYQLELMTPNLLRALELDISSGDWSYRHHWRDIPLYEALREAIAGAPPTAGYSIEQLDATTFELACQHPDPETPLMIRIHLSELADHDHLASGDSLDIAIKFSAKKGLSEKSHKPDLAITSVSRQDGAVEGQNWAKISGAWDENQGLVEFAHEISISPEKSDIAFDFYWAPRTNGDHALLHQPAYSVIESSEK